MKEETEIEKIKRIMAKPEANNKVDLNNYSIQDKFKGIYSFVENTNVSMDMSFIDSVADSYDTYGRITDRQERALNNIIKKFNINLELWL